MSKTLIVAEKPSVARDLAAALPGTFKQSKDKTSLEADASVRAGLKEAVDALWLRTEVKRRKAVLGWGELAHGSDALFLSGYRGRSGDAIATKSQRLTPGDLLGCRWAGGREDDG